MHRYRKKTIKALLAFLLIFAVVFGASTYYLARNVPLVNIGLSASLINGIISILSFLCILLVLVEISRVEDAKTYEKRVIYKNF